MSSVLLDDAEPLDQPLLLSSTFSPIDDSDNGSSPPKQSVQVSQSSNYVRQLSSLRARWIILLLSCVTLAGNYYSFDTPAALHQQLKNELSPDEEFEVHFNLLYTVYSFPNIILPFFGGKFTDKYGQTVCLMVFCSLTLVGQLVFAVGLYIKSWTLMLIGRVIYGCGGESVTVASSTILSTWFANGKEIALAFGVSLAISRLGSVLNNMISPAIANVTTPSVALLGGAFMNFCSFIAAMAIFHIDRKFTRKLDEQNRVRGILAASLLEEQEDDESQELSAHCSNDNLLCVSDGGPKYHEKKFGSMFWLLTCSCVVVYGCVIPFNDVASGILLERNYFKSPGAYCALLHPDQCVLGSLVSNSSNPSRSLIDGSQCPGQQYAPILPSSLNITYSESSWDQKSYVFSTLKSSDVDCDDFFWAEACTKNYCDSQKAATEEAGRAMSIPYFMSAILSPLLGYMVDKIGLRAVIASFAPFVLTIVHGVLGLGNGSPVIPLMFQGVAYSMYAAVIWPSVPLVVEPTLTGSAYGSITSFQNLGLAVFPLVVAETYSIYGAYIPFTEMFFVLLATFGVLIGIFLNIYDGQTGGTLNSVFMQKSRQ